MTRRLVLAPGFLIEGEQVLPDEMAHYVRRVLRLRPETELLLSDGEGLEATGVLLANDRVAISQLREAPQPVGPKLTLIQGLAKGDKMDSVVRQATELGVRIIQPVLCKRSIAEQHGRLQRWRQIAEDAVRVSGRSHRPVINPVIVLNDLWDQARVETSICLVLNAQEKMPACVTEAEILIGPEGGLTEAEITAAESHGFTLSNLGGATLRTETAGSAALSILMYGSGGFG